jgi:hypothetical protein
VESKKTVEETESKRKKEKSVLTFTKCSSSSRVATKIIYKREYNRVKRKETK